MLKYIFGLIFIILAWVAVKVFELPDAWAIWVTVFVVLGLALWVGIKWLRARQAASKIESALAKGGADDGLRPEVRAQIEEMQAEFQKALRTLKGSKLGGAYGNGNSALAALPWYVIIGPPGSGKSTLLRNSGLKFPYLSAKRGAVRGVAGTRNCDWWLSNEGILLDTAGRWSTEDDDQDEWLAFLDLLRQTRRGRPLNGVLLSISAGDLFDTEAEDIPVLAKKLRERIDEVMKRLEVTLPVYLMVTKCDLIGGFVETFGTLSEKERGQIWGLTLPLDADSSVRPEMFVERLDRLVDVIETYSLVRLKGEGRSDVARRLYEFPQQFEELCPSLVDLVNDLFADNAYQDTPILRGVYFTSATQEGRPIDRVVQRMAKAIGLSANVEYQPVLKAKSYFLRDMLRSVIFPDQNVAGQGEKALARTRWAAIGAAAGIFLVAFAIALMPVMAYSRNLQLARQARDYVEGLVGGSAINWREPLPARIEGLYEASQEILRQSIDPDTGITFGFYQGDKINPMIGRVAREYVVQPILGGDWKKLATLARPEARNYQDSIAALHLNKLLTSPKAEDEPRPGKGGDEAIKESRAMSVARWQAHLGERGLASTPRSEQVVADAVEMYLRQSEKNPDLWEPRAYDPLEKFRLGLCEFVKRAPLDGIVKDPKLSPFDITLNQVVGGLLALFSDSPRLAGAYTQTGWPLIEAMFLARSENSLASRDWALQGCEALSSTQVALLRKQYLVDYEAKWRDFLEKVRPKAARDFDDARQRLGRYSEEKPLRKLWATLGEKMPPLPRTGALANADKAAGSFLDKIRTGAKSAGALASLGVKSEDLKALERRFDPLLKFGIPAKEGDTVALDTYYNHLRTAVNALKAFDDTRDPKALRQDVTRAKRDIDELISRSDPGEWDGVLRTLLLTPLEGLQVVVKRVGDDSANSRWRENVVVPFEQLLGDRYPFGTGIDADLIQVSKFFHPQTGTLWVYVKEALGADLEPQSFRVRPTASISYTPELTAYLRRAQVATDLLFSPAGQLGFTLQVKIWPAGTYVNWISLRFGNSPPLVHRNEPERFAPLTWPARDVFLDVQLAGGGKADIPKWMGDWALFRFLDAGSPRVQIVDQEQVLHWSRTVSEGVQVQMDFKPSNLHSALRNLRPPRAVTAGRD